MSPTLKPPILHCRLRWKSSGRCKVVLLLRLNSLLHECHYTVFTLYRTCYTAFTLYPEFFKECLTLYSCMYRIPYTLFTSVKRVLCCIYLRTEILTMPSLLYRMPYSYSHIWMLNKSNASCNTQNGWHVQKTQFCSQHLRCRLRTQHTTYGWGIPCRQHNSPCLEYRLTTWARVCIFIIWTKPWTTGFQVILHLPVTTTRTLQATIIVNVDVIPWPERTTCLKKNRNHIHKYLPNSIQVLLDWTWHITIQTTETETINLINEYKHQKEEKN